MSKIITVLGASGNVGKLVVSYLAEKAYNVRAVGRKLPKYSDSRISNHEVDFESLEQIMEIVEGSDSFICLIGLEYKTGVWQEKWPSLVEKLILVAEKTSSKFIFFDNVYGYGLVEGKMTENSPLRAETGKGLVRQELDEMIQKAIDKKKIKAVIAKSADFYGPEIYSSVLSDRFFVWAKEKGTAEVFGNPLKKHNYTYVGDIAPALEKLINSDFTGNIHLPTQKPLTGLEFGKVLEEVLNKPIKIVGLRKSTVFFLRLFIPILRELYEMMYQSENDYNFDSHKILKMFPDLKVTSYEEGFKETLDWWEKKAK